MRAAMERYDPAYIMLVNNDARYLRGDLSAMLAFADQHQDIGIIAPHILDAQGKIWSAGGEINMSRGLCKNRGLGLKDNGTYTTRQAVDFVSGCVMLIRTTLINRIGMLDIDYGAYMEDADYCVRARKAGFSVLYYPAVCFEHAVSQSFGDQYANNPSFYRWRNRLIFMHNNTPVITRIIFMGAIFPLIALRDIIRYILRGKWSGLGNLFKGLFDYLS
jgi:hypothetical protein